MGKYNFVGHQVMTYQPKWLNRFEQYGQVNYSLLLVDDEKIRPDVRVEKSFSAKLETKEYLNKLSQEAVENTIKEQDNPSPKVKTDADVIVDLLAQIEVLQAEIDRLKGGGGK
jgi:hypothetical protein